jgi:hypothetical protein
MKGSTLSARIETGKRKRLLTRHRNRAVGFCINQLALPAAVKLGRRVGLATARKLTPDERSESARRAEG